MRSGSKDFLKCIAWSLGALESKQDLLVYIYLKWRLKSMMITCSSKTIR
jgi:hypothetical protein